MLKYSFYTALAHIFTPLRHILGTLFLTFYAIADTPLNYLHIFLKKVSFCHPKRKKYVTLQTHYYCLLFLNEDSFLTTAFGAFRFGVSVK